MKRGDAGLQSNHLSLNYKHKQTFLKIYRVKRKSIIAKLITFKTMLVDNRDLCRLQVNF